MVYSLQTQTSHVDLNTSCQKLHYVISRSFPCWNMDVTKFSARPFKFVPITNTSPRQVTSIACKDTHEGNTTYDSFPSSSSYIKLLNTGPMGPFEADAEAMLSSSFLFWNYHVMKKANTVTRITVAARVRWIRTYRTYRTCTCIPVRE